MKKIGIVLVAFVILVVGFLIFRNARVTEEERIVRVIRKGEATIEKKDFVGCLKLISPEYIDRYGNDRRNVLFILRQIFGEYEGIFIHIEGLDAVVAQDKKTAEAKFAATILAARGGSQEREPIVEKGKDRFLFTFKKEDGDWKVISAEQLEYRFK